MKFILLVVICGLTIAECGMLTSQKGSFDLSLGQKSPKKKTFVPYMMCLDSVPILVDITVRNKNLSVLHTYQASVTEIFIHGFILQMEGTVEDDWQENLFVDWTFYSGPGIVQNRKYIWMPEPSKKEDQTRAEADMSCRNFNATLVDIGDKQMYDAVYSYVSATMASVNEVNAYVWLAMNYNPTTGLMTLSTGEQGYKGSWHPNYPNSETTRTAIWISVQADPTKTNVGLLNLRPTSGIWSRLLCALPL